MFSIKSLLTLAAVAVFSVNAAPAPVNDDGSMSLNKRDGALIWMCKDNFFKGSCQMFGVAHNSCGLYIGNDYNDKVSSYNVQDQGSWSCTFYEHSNCQGKSYSAQRDDNLHDGDGFWADRISSIKCWHKNNCGGAPLC